jgi:hypothetical protein
MGMTFAIAVTILLVEFLILYFCGKSATGSDDYGAGVLFFLLLAVFAVIDLGLLIWWIVAHWRS